MYSVPVVTALYVCSNVVFNYFRNIYYALFFSIWRYLKVYLVFVYRQKSISTFSIEKLSNFASYYIPIVVGRRYSGGVFAENKHKSTICRCYFLIRFLNYERHFLYILRYCSYEFARVLSVGSSYFFR